MELFFSDRTNCSVCHGGFNFTDYRFANNGLDTSYADIEGCASPVNRKIFLVQRCRLPNIALTAPYMHDGSIATLEEVVHHYNTGGKAHPIATRLYGRCIFHQKKNRLL